MITRPSRSLETSGNIILMVLVMVGAALLMVGASLRYTFSSNKQSFRYNQYTRTVSAAEAATEKVLVYLNDDFQSLGQGYVGKHLDSYRAMVPTASEDPNWANYKFTNLSGTNDRVHVEYIAGSNLVSVSTEFKGLLGFPCTYRIVATAQESNSPLPVKAAVEQQVQLTLIPIFQFAMFYNLDYECNALPNMVVTGPVHCNGDIYLTPINSLSFNSDVTCTKTIYRSPKTGNSVGSANSGTVVYNGKHVGGTSTMTLPVGTNNSVTAVRQIVEPAPFGESADSSMGQLRFYNKADMLILVSNATVTVRSGQFNNFATPVQALDYTNFVNTNVTFYNGREKKTIKATQIDISKLALWNATPTNVLKSILPYGDVRILYVADYRTQSASTEAGIKLLNGQTILPQGLTVASPHPVYIQGNYNCTNNAHLGTTNTSSSLPASIVADAITILSPAWSDAAATSSSSLSSRTATNTTVNAAFITGIVQTTSANGYSGGVENLPRFLEDWSISSSGSGGGGSSGSGSGSTATPFTYNGSMVVMFESVYATAPWVNIGGYYNPPERRWSFDTNFRDPLKLPPGAPAAYQIMRGTWQVIAAN